MGSGNSLADDEGNRPFPIIGIGASAGGLEALDHFLKNIDVDSEAAFVVVQHLDPTQKGMLPELLQRATSLPIHQIKDGMVVEPAHVYVIPPNADVGLLRNRLYVTKPLAPRGLRLPIDFFFRSMAEERHENAIGVILSGMGSDGTNGLRAIKDKGGLALVQAPESAKFDGMPRSAIEAGLADIVAPPEELPGKISGFLNHSLKSAPQEGPIDAKALSALEKIVLLLRSRTGNDFSLYKKSTVYRRVERRMAIHQIDRIASYVNFLRENPTELDLLFKELLIGVTNFFRDTAVWEKLKKNVLPELFARQEGGGQLRAWVAGCSTGEEAYSLAMTFLESIDEVRPQGSHTLQIFATDLDKEAVEKGRQGIFPASIAADVSPERLGRFFHKHGNSYRVGKAIREMVIFADHNLIRDPPFTKLDLLFCRNLLIYLEPELQKKLFPLFRYSLKPGGALFLGSAESLNGFMDCFDTLFGKERIFRRREGGVSVDSLSLPHVFSSGDGKKDSGKASSEQNIEALTDKLVLQKYSPAAVLITDGGDILYSSARTGKYLEPPIGKANLNVFNMAREFIRDEILGAIQKVRRDGGTITHRGLSLGEDGGGQLVDVAVSALTEPAQLKGKILIVFTDSTERLAAKELAKPGSGKTSAVSRRVAELEAELCRAKEELQTTREEMQSSQEELKSANEELQSTNEELQSTNEELTTSREEMQSMNEELQSLNAELSSKLDELSRSSSDMKNLLNAIDIATIFLDGKLRVRRFTDRATRIVKLIQGDIGRPFTDLSSTLLYPDLSNDAREVLRTLVFSDKQAATSDGSWYQVRIMPYRTLEDRIDGVVITFSDITSIKKLEGELRKDAAGKREGK